MNYTTTVHRADWQSVLKRARLANIFHAPEYFDIQTALGHTLVYLACYDAGQPIGIIAGYRNNFGYHTGLIEVGTKSGGYPVLIDAYDQRPDADQIKNDFIEAFARQYLDDQHFFFYPCFHLKQCLFEDPMWQCVKQADAAVLLDLQPDEAVLWKQLGDKGRNMVRNAQRKGVTARVANELPYFEQFYHFYEEEGRKHQRGYIGCDELRAKFDAFTRNGIGDLWVAFQAERPLAYAFIWKYKQIINLVYMSSNPAEWDYKPNNLLQWEIIRQAKQQGYTLYNMWGVRNMNLNDMQTSTEIEGYGKFKLSFGGALRELVRYVRV